MPTPKKYIRQTIATTGALSPERLGLVLTYPVHNRMISKNAFSDIDARRSLIIHGPY